MAKKEVVGPMKLTVPAIRAAEPDAHRQEVSEHTGQLLDAIDTLLAESLATTDPYQPKRGHRVGVAGRGELANRAIGRPRTGGRRVGGHGARPVPPAAA